MMRRKRGHSQGLDQLGTTQAWKGNLNMPDLRGSVRSLETRIKTSATQRKVKITLSDHLMKSSEIKTK